MKHFLNLRDVKKLEKKEQQSINGGLITSCPSEGGYCTIGMAVTCITAVELRCINGRWTSNFI